MEEKKDYFFALEMGSEEFIGLTKGFAGINREEIVKMLQNHSKRILRHITCVPEAWIVFSNGRHYMGKTAYDNEGLWAERFEEIDIKAYEGKAIKNAYKAIEGGLEGGDKLLINDIARRCFHASLERVICGERDWTLDKCLRLDSNEAFIVEAERYGFKIQSKRIFSYECPRREGD